MGKLIKDFWTYSYKNKQYFGICEVVMGEDLKQQRHIKKYETHIEKALDYMLEPGRKIVSHMSIQKYTSFLKKEKPFRSSDEDTYYPFFFEIEPRYGNQYGQAVSEALRLVLYLIYELDVNEDDILIMVNNSRSIYIMVNPKSYNLKPAKNLHLIYKEMYRMISESVDLKYVDTSLYSHYSLMKTPNSFYAGGYFVAVSLSELRQLNKDNSIRSVLTKEKRSLDRQVPAESAAGLIKLYDEAKEKIWKSRREDTGKSSKGRLCILKKATCKCVQHIENNQIEKGCRNHALISVAIYYKNQGYQKEQVLEIITGLARSWGHDETTSDLKSKVNSVFRYDYKFSCEKARAVLDSIDMDSICSNCPYNQKHSFRANTIQVHADVIRDLWDHRASTRHYLAYLQMSKMKAFNRWIDAKELGISSRIIRELCTFTDILCREMNKGMIYISLKAQGNAYYLPNSFLDRKVPEILGDYLKHYLKLLIKGYKPYNNYILLRASKETLAREFGYTDPTSAYKLIKKLDDIGILIPKKNKVICLYYESYKVKDINHYKEEKKAQKGIIRPENVEYISEESAVSPNSEIQAVGYDIRNRGSP